MERRDESRPWLTEDFEVRFKQALGREMTPAERAYFGLNGTKTDSGKTAAQDDEDDA